MKLFYLILFFLILYILTNKNESYIDIYDTTKDCCFVEQRVNSGNNFIYNYQKKKCRPNFIGSNFNYALISPDQVKLENCNNKNKDLGSCRKDSRECINFTTKKKCDKFNMVWSKEPCLNPIEGSCRNSKECINVSNKKECNKLNMVWSKEFC